LLSRKRSSINLRLVASALALQFFMAFIALKTGGGQRVLHSIAFAIGKLYMAADEGAAFVFGDLTQVNNMWGFIFAFKVLPVIIFFGAFTALLFHFGIIQRLVAIVNILVRPLLGTSGAETLCAIANSFLGQTEAPLLIRHYLKNMTSSELLVVMISGMATISGAILVVFAAMGVPVTHMLASSIMSIPAAILIAKIIYPETETPQTARGANLEVQKTSHNIFDAIFTGTSDGLQLALNVAAMLISFLALLGLANFVLAYGGYKINYLLAYAGLSWQLPELSMQVLFSYIFAPFGYLLGFTDTEALKAGQLLGIKVAVNELIAYGEMVKMQLSERTMSIMTYALCGFSNFSCIGIQLGGIGALVPEKRRTLASLGLTAVIGAAMANLLSAMIAALLL
jgi:CNT family concentrative nucleoside transporter